MRRAHHIASYLRDMPSNEGGSYEIRLKGHLERPLGRLVRRADPDSGERRHHGAQWLGGGPGSAARPAWQSARSRPAVDRRQSKERPVKITSSNLMRLAGLCAVLAGVIFAGIQPIHPPDVVESVTTGAWAIITPSRPPCACCSWSASPGCTPGRWRRRDGLAWPAFVLLSRLVVRC